MMRASVFVLAVAAVLACTASAVASQAITGDGVVWYYGFDTPGDPMAGSIGGGVINGVDGPYNSVANPEVNGSGQALWGDAIQCPIATLLTSNYNNKDGVYIDQTNAVDLGDDAPTGQMTIAFWIKPTAKVPVETEVCENAQQAIIRSANFGFARMYLIPVRNSNTGGLDAPCLKCLDYGFSINLYDATATAFVERSWDSCSNEHDMMRDQWSHFALTYDKDANAGAGACKLYINGELEEELDIKPDVAPALNTGWASQPTRVTFGRHSSGRNLVSPFDEFYLCNYVLSDTQIQTLAAPEPGTLALVLSGLVGLLLYWRKR